MSDTLVVKGEAEKDMPPIQLQDQGSAPEWTCPTCGGDALFCACRKGEAEGRSRAVPSELASELRGYADALSSVVYWLLAPSSNGEPRATVRRAAECMERAAKALGEAGASHPVMPEPLRTHLGWLLTKIRNNPDYPEARGIWERYTDWQNSVTPPTDTAPSSEPQP